ncbi:unnamed protein product [Ceratitis capitata]|uniref:(Mediterranean fruit fly) hypothetical protein n=1 Tax=Ceratitis capitata TaxID=7213 RepID=A0A811USU3_CERCA|nr:unnamed protein product [Ceratitis capitata]
MRPPQRIAVAIAPGYCSNCLALTHDTEEWDPLGSCRRCNKAHHTMLHPSEPQTGGLIPKPTTKTKKQLHYRATQQRAIEQRTTATLRIVTCPTTARHPTARHKKQQPWEPKVVLSSAYVHRTGEQGV